MILYVNGDSHSAGAEATTPHCFANDDPSYSYLGRRPHPDNLSVSYGHQLANQLNYSFHCDAESASSNDRILRTTQEYLKSHTPDLLIIGWATWEREEFLIDNVYYQFSSGRIIQDWPNYIEEQYKKWVVTANPAKKAKYWHDTIYQFHKELLTANINHLFFNTFTSFNHDFISQLDWQNNYIDPYSHDNTYYYWLQNQGFKTVNTNSYHYGQDAHNAWANHLTKVIKESIITT